MALFEEFKDEYTDSKASIEEISVNELLSEIVDEEDAEENDEGKFHCLLSIQ